MEHLLCFPHPFLTSSFSREETFSGFFLHRKRKREEGEFLLSGEEREEEGEDKIFSVTGKIYFCQNKVQSQICKNGKWQN